MTYSTTYEKYIIGASLSEPHIDEFAVDFLSLYIYIMYRTSCRKSLPALILRVLASFVNSKTIHQWPKGSVGAIVCVATVAHSQLKSLVT